MSSLPVAVGEQTLSPSGYCCSYMPLVPLSQICSDVLSGEGGAAAARTDEGGVVPLPAGIRPLLRRRLEEMKKRSHASVLKGNQTLSKKELLRHGSSEVDDGEEMEEKHDSLKLSAKVAPVPDHHVEEKKEVIYENISSRDGVKEVKKEEEIVKKQDEDNHHHGVVDDVAMNVNKEGDNGSNHNEHDKVINDKKDEDDSVDHDEGRMSNFDERMICPGSPSFRVYCIDVTSDDDEEEEKDAEDTRKSMESESVLIESKEDESIVKKEKRERKGKRFGIALPRKYLANVTAGCMGNHTHARLMQEKSSQ
ncbi:BnaA02g11540D [Brassica napus]|uniref:BnaA02g11540D protein n=1 Tax=Brassica napus TaxID=3708 RepID=A0A078FPF6_BRANA|nr:BnaA02g11540D [Brassica napus]